METSLNKNIEKVDIELLASMIRSRPEIPDGQIEDIKITHEVLPAGKKIQVVTMRNALFMGQQPTACVFEEPLTIRQLSYDGGTWMTDQPQEIWQMREAIELAWGKVLVGGLGLGVISHMLSMLSLDVGDITTIELDRRIIKLVQPHIDADWIIQDSIFKYVKTIEEGDYDFAFFDHWQMTGQTVWATDVVPLRRACYGKIEEVYCWNEEEMHGQLVMHLPVWADADIGGSVYPGFNKVFREAIVAAGIRPRKPLITGGGEGSKLLEVGQANSEDEEVMVFLRFFLKEVGSPEWEKTFGKLWDEFVKV